MNKRDKRINELIQTMKEMKQIDIKELAQLFHVTEMTIRRDLDILQSNRLVSLERGVVTYITDHLTFDDKYTVLQHKNMRDEDKEKIAKEAAKLVVPGDSIIVDIGTTTYKLLRYIPNNFQITVFCYSITALTEALRKNFAKLIFGGGFYHPSTQMFESVETTELIKRSRASKYFMSAAGVCDKLGLTCVNQHEILTKKTSLESAKTIILLCDSGKFGKVKPGHFADLSVVDQVITDEHISDEWLTIFKNLEIPVTIAR